MKPDWNITSYISSDNEYHVNEKIILDLPFCNLIKFESTNLNLKKQKVLIIAPMSGHYATLVRKTVISLRQTAKFMLRIGKMLEIYHFLKENLILKILLNILFNF